MGETAEYNRGMRMKTSVTLSKELLDLIDRVETNRSLFLERAARRYLAEIGRERQDVKDIALINENAESLNGEAMDVLEYQGLP